MGNEALGEESRAAAAGEQEVLINEEDQKERAQVRRRQSSPVRGRRKRTIRDEGRPRKKEGQRRTGDSDWHRRRELI